jgi:CheY-like chemotaxis protein
MRILVIDDEKWIADSLTMILQGEGHNVISAYDGAAALDKIRSFVPDCVISDIFLPGMNGIEVCAIIEETYPQCHILLFSGQASTSELMEKARAQGHAWELLPKPIDPEELLLKISSLTA